MKNKPYPLYQTNHIDTLQDLLLLCKTKHSDKKAFWYADRKGSITEISYAQFVRDTETVISFIQSQHIEKSGIGIYGENSYEWIVAYFAAVCSGNFAVPVDKDLPVNEAKDILDRADCKLMFFADNYSDEVSQMQLIETASVNMNSFNNMEYSEPAPVEIHENDLAAIVFTSGTTGKSKSVMLTHKNIAADAENSEKILDVPEGTILLLPLHHTFGMMAGVICQLLLGFPVFINQSLRFLKRDIELAKPGHLAVVPLIIESLYKSIWDNAKKSGKEKLLKRMVSISNALLKIGIDLRRVLFKSVIDGLGGNLKILISGGAPISADLINGIESFGIKPINGYGITECSPIVSVTRNKHSNFPSTGCVIPCCEVKIINPDENGIGEICVKGDTVSQGYYDSPEATAESFKDGWFITGDLGYTDKDGFLYICGRKKNLIILSNGKNISPEELECLVSEIENVDEVIVYGENDLITAEIYAEDRSGIEDGIDALNKTLPMYKQIQKIKFRDSEFEKTTTKKIRRNTNV